MTTIVGDPRMTAAVVGLQILTVIVGKITIRRHSQHALVFRLGHAAPTTPASARPAAFPHACCTLSSAAVQLPAPKRMQPLIPVHRAALACQMPSRRQPIVHPVTIRAVQLRIRQPTIQTQKGARVPTAHLKISPPTAVRLHHHRPHPAGTPLAAPPRPHISPHLVKRNHPRRPRPPLSPLLPGHPQHSSSLDRLFLARNRSFPASRPMCAQ